MTPAERQRAREIIQEDIDIIWSIGRTYADQETQEQAEADASVLRAVLALLDAEEARET